MLLVPLRSIRPGMTLARPVCHPYADIVLLNTGYRFTPEIIERLHEFYVTHVWVEFPGLDEIDEVVNDKISQGHLAMCQALEGSVDSIEGMVNVRQNLGEYTRVVRQMLAEIVADPGHEIITHQLASCQSSLAGHLANACYLALMIGSRIGGYLQAERHILPSTMAENTWQLGLGALLHDIGKLADSDEQARCTILNPASRTSAYRSHVERGFELVREHLTPVTASVALHHHQRFGGGGFPLRVPRDGVRPPHPLEGHEIHIFSRIVSVVDVFDHLLTFEGRAVPTIAAIRALSGERFAGWFDPVVVQTLFRVVPPFAAGAVVTLSDGREAVVIRNRLDTPCQPMVKPLMGDLNRPRARVADDTIDLRHVHDLSIVAVDGIDVRPYLYYRELSPPPTRTPVPAGFDDDEPW